jgi:hypothetical protein
LESEIFFRYGSRQRMRRRALAPFLPRAYR